MKTHTIKYTLIAAAIAGLFSQSTSFADDHLATALLKFQPAAVYQAIHGQSLTDTLSQVAQRSGISFKINTDLGQDVVNQSVAADSWANAIQALLVNYNYTVIQENAMPKTVIITGHKNDGGASVVASANSVSRHAEDVIVVERKLTKLPHKYESLPASSVMAVSLPVKSMMQLSNNATVDLALPMGQFNITHDNTVNEADGSQTWVGHLSNEGEGYRLFVSQGAAGTMGMITTPDGTYNIESDNKGQTYLIDTNKLQHAGYEGDAVMPPQALMASITGKATANATVDQISQLQAAVAAAQTALNTANTTVTNDQTLVNNDKALLATALANYNAANAKSSQAYTTYYAAVMAYYAKPSNTTLNAAYAAQSVWTAATNAVNVAYSAYIGANTAYNNANSALTTAKTVAATALANYNQAVAALNTAEGNPNLGSTTTTNSGSNTVDLMVVYTTVAQTQAYAQQRIGLLVTASNQAYVDSHINMQLRLVHTEATSYSESSSNAQALSDLSAGNGAFAGISQKRTQYGADLVFLFRPLYAKTAGSCGTTYLEFANGTAASASLGFGTIGDGNSVDGAGYYCTVNAFTHEIGHTLGLVHDRPNAGSSVGVFPYAYAYGVNGTFGTIMSYDLPVLMYFSTPLLSTQCAGQPCGYAQSSPNSSDQTSAVNYTAPIVAGFLPTTTAVPVLQ